MEDEENCCICFDGVVYDNNEIVFCDSCGIAVHRDCYGIDEIPPGDIPWYCQPCAEGINSKTVKCALCPFPGGAFSRIEDPISKSMSPWCHVVCATWLPDVTIRDKASQLSISLHEMDRSRENLKCVLCGERGVSIQCLHPTCYRAFHPWCALRAHSTRVASGLGADGLFATYCKQHMSKYTHEDDGFIMIKENPDAGDQEFQKHLEKSKSFCPEIATCSHKETKIDLEPKEDVDEKKTSAICDPEDVDEDEASSATCDPEEKEYTDEEEGIVTSSGEEEDVDDEDDVDDIDEESSAACDLKAKENVDEEEKCAACDDPEPKEDVDEEKRITPRTRKRSRINPAPKKDVVDEERITPRTRNRMRINPEPKEDVDEEERITPRTRKRTRIETSVEDLIQQKITPRPRKKKKIVKEPKPEAVHVECTEESSCAEFWETIDMDFFHDPEAAIPQKYCAEPTLTTTRMSDANVVVQTLESQQQPCHPMFEIEQLARSESKTDHIRVLFTKDESQQCFAMEYSVVPNDERKLVATRCESVPYAGGTAPDPQVCQIDIEITKLYHQIGELERMNRCRLEELKKKVPIRARNNYPEKEECQYLALRNSKLITASLKRGIVDRPIVEEGSCVVCFDGSSNEDNQIVFCDSCNIAVHQSCFGVFQVPDGDFYCDRCQEEDHVHIENRACTLCPLKGGAFKRTTCGRWVHVFCALWCPKATIRDGSTLSPVDTVPAIESNRGVVCSVCCIPVGWTTTCAHEGCEIAMHPYCGWRDGMYGHVADAVPSNLQLQLYCGQHTPEHAIGGTRRENQAKMRLEILNSIRTSRKKRHKLDRRQRIIRPDVYRQDLCAVCFTKSEAALIQCTSCGLVVHPLCSMSPISPDTIHYQCTACVANVSRCSLCPRTGGFLVGIENTELWAHVYCIVACSALSGSNPNAAAELRKKINSTTTACSFCTKREGHVVSCHVKHCTHVVHPLCCVMQNGYFDTFLTERKRWYCARHTPKDQVYDPYRCRWIPVADIVFMRALRLSLERARTLIDLCRRRERQRKRLVEADAKVFEAAYPLLTSRVVPQALKMAFHDATGTIFTPYPTRAQVQEMTTKSGRMKRSVATYTTPVPRIPPVVTQNEDQPSIGTRNRRAQHGPKDEFVDLLCSNVKASDYLSLEELVAQYRSDWLL